MLKQFSSSPFFFPYFSNDYNSTFQTVKIPLFIKNPKLKTGSNLGSKCFARRRVIYEEEEEEEEYGYNAEVAMLETYTQSARNEALLVTAMVDEEEVEVLIFKDLRPKRYLPQIEGLLKANGSSGFSSCLSYGTSPDPSRSVLPSTAVIKFIDRVKGPFDPSNIQYIEQGLTWEIFKNRIT